MALPFIDAKADYGAVGDYVVGGGGSYTDDTTAIQNAATAAAGGILVIPAGTYQVTSPINIPSTTEVIGAGGGVNYGSAWPEVGATTIVKTNANTNGISVFYANENNAFRDLYFIGPDQVTFLTAGTFPANNNPNFAIYGLNPGSRNNLVVERVVARYFANAGIGGYLGTASLRRYSGVGNYQGIEHLSQITLASAVTGSSSTSCTVSNAAHFWVGGSIYFQGGTPESKTITSISGTTISWSTPVANNHAIGSEVSNDGVGEFGSDLTVDGSTLRHSVRHGIYSEHSYMRVTNCRIEWNARRGIDAGAQALVVGNLFDRNGWSALKINGDGYVVTGNYFDRSGCGGDGNYGRDSTCTPLSVGYSAPNAAAERTHIRIGDATSGPANNGMMAGNRFDCRRDDGGGGARGPKFLISLNGVNCTFAPNDDKAGYKRAGSTGVLRLAADAAANQGYIDVVAGQGSNFYGNGDSDPGTVTIAAPNQETKAIANVNIGGGAGGSDRLTFTTGTKLGFAHSATPAPATEVSTDGFGQYQDPAYNVPGVGAVASAGTMNLPGSEPYVEVSGNASITAINGATPGQIVVFKFSGTASIANSGTFKLSANFNAANKATLTMVWNGTNWFELARSFN